MSKRDIEEGRSIIKDLSIGNIKIDASDPANISKKVLDERDTRKRFLTRARQIGREKEMLILFAKYDNLLRNCNNPEERKGISQLGAYEVGKLLEFDELVVNGITVIQK
jgi:hypothetical protein